MLGSRKRRDTSEQTNARNVSASRGRHAKKVGLAVVFEESVVDTVINDMRENKTFWYTDESTGKTGYVCMLLNTDDIGGINKKTRRNESIGSFIECVTGRKIESYMTADMMDAQYMVILPTKDTLDHMSEFAMLDNGDLYSVAIVDDSGLVYADTNKKVPFSAFYDVVYAQASADVKKLVAALVSNNAPNFEKPLFVDDDAEPVNLDEPKAPILPEAIRDENLTRTATPEEAKQATSGNHIGDTVMMAPVEADKPQTDSVDAGVTMVMPKVEAVVEPTAVETVDDTPSVEPDVVEQDVVAEEKTPKHAKVEESPIQDVMSDEEDFEDVEEPVEEDKVYDQTDVDDAIVHYVCDENLNLEYNLNVFDARFKDIINNFEPIKDDYKDTWLGTQLNEMAAQANSEMRNARNDKMATIRSEFGADVSMMVSHIALNFALDNEGNDYCKAIKECDEKFARDKENLRAKQEERKRQLESEFNKEVEDHAELAANAARTQYVNTHKHANNAKIAIELANMATSLESDYYENRRRLLDERANAAQKELNDSILVILDQAGIKVNSTLDMERITRDRVISEIDKCRNDRAQNDADRVKALLEEHKRVNKVAQSEKRREEEIAGLTKKYETEIKGLKDAHADVVSKMQSEIDSNRNTYNNEKEQLNSMYERQIIEVRSERDAALDRVKSLMNDYAALDDKKEKLYKFRLEQAQGETKVWEEKFDALMAHTKRMNVVSITATIVAIIAALAVGVVIGMYSNFEMNNDAVSQAVSQSFDEKANQIIDNMNAEE